MATIQWLNGSHMELQNQNRKYSPKALTYQGFYYLFFGKLF
ncbi:hypothetical protein [Streptococcus lutetiensis]|nr:hypothetical protein [Streptococcus lutetiensis]